MRKCVSHLKMRARCRDGQRARALLTELMGGRDTGADVATDRLSASVHCVTDARHRRLCPSLHDGFTQLMAGRLRRLRQIPSSISTPLNSSVCVKDHEQDRTERIIFSLVG